MIVDIIVYLSVLSGKEHSHVCYLRNVVILVYIKYIYSSYLKLKSLSI